MKLKTWLAIWPNGHVAADWPAELSESEAAILFIENEYWSFDPVEARLVKVEIDVPDDLWETEPSPYDLAMGEAQN